MNTRDFETGVDYDDDAVHLSDRLTHVCVKGDDHPVPFAQGVSDGTQQGMFFASTTSAEQATAAAAASSGGDSGGGGASSGWTSHGPAWGPEEMAAEMGCPDTSKLGEEGAGAGAGTGAGAGVVMPLRRTFHPRDKELQFDAREEFSGRREGCVFRLGGRGLGYYEDRPLTEAELSSMGGEKQDAI
jgi:hypothetical protein